MSTRRLLVTSCVLALALACGRLSAHLVDPAGTGPEPLVIRNVTVVDPAAGAHAGAATILVKDGRIASITPGAALGADTARVVDGTGKYLIPGLWDMHVHLNRKADLKKNVGWGVTGVRVMWGNFQNYGEGSHTDWRARILARKLLGPRLVVASTMIDGKPELWPGSDGVATAAAGRAAVQKARRQGADFVKVYSLLKPDVHAAIADEARAQGLPFGGHLPYLVAAKDAVAAGQRTFEHWYGIRGGCARDQVAVRQAVARAMDQAAASGPATRRGRRSSQGLAVSNAAMKAEMAYDASFDDAVAQDLFAALAQRGTFVCPTIHMLSKRQGDPLMPPEVLAHIKVDVASVRRLLPAMRRAGVTVLAGSDEPNADLRPGEALHGELAELVRSGLTPAEALRAATSDAARAANVHDLTGAVAVGKEADLVLLDADPLADIANTRRIAAVVLRGLLIDRPQLESFRGPSPR